MRKEELSNILNGLIMMLSFSIPTIGYHIPKYILGVVIGFKIAEIVLYAKYYKECMYTKKKQLCYLSAFFFFLMLTLSYTKALDLGINVLSKYSYMLIFPIVLIRPKIISNVDGVSVLKAFLYGVIFVQCFNLILGLITYGKHIFLNTHEISQILHYFSYENLAEVVKLHPGYYSLMVFIAFCVNYYFNTSRFRYAIGLLQFLFLVLLASRTILFLFLCFLLFLTVKFLIQSNVIFLRKIILLCSIGILGCFVVQKIDLTNTYRVSNFNNAKEILSNEIESGLQISTTSISSDFIARIYQIKSALQTIVKTPITFIFGYGIGDFHLELLKTYEENNFQWGVLEDFNSHNQYLSTLLMGGTIGLFFLIQYLITPLWFCKGKQKKFYKSVLLVLLGYACTESYLLRENGIIVISFFVSSLVLIPTTNRIQKKSIFNH